MSQTKAQLISDLVQALNFTGTASAPANGAFLSAANTLALATNSAQRLTIDSNGLLLVGTTTEGHSNADDLTIATSGHTGISLRSGTTNNGSVFFSDGTSGADEYRGWIQYTHTSNYLTFGTNAEERMRIDSTGKVAIGLNDAKDNHLLVRGSSTVGTKNGHIMLSGDSATVGQGPQIVFSESGVSGTFAGAYIGHLREGSNSIGPLVFGTRGSTGDADSVPSERMRITNDGKVGIGTTTIGNKLQVHEASSNASFAGFSNDTTGSSSSDGLIVGVDSDENGVLYHYENKAIRFATNNAERMRINASGNIGIGGTAPNYQLHATTNIAVGAHGFAQQLLLGNNSIQSQLLGTGYTPLSLNGLGGNVGIGTTSPVARLHIHNAGTGSGDHAYAYFTTGDTGSSASDGLTIGVAATAVASITYREAGDLTFGTNGAERIRIKSGGNVGIGTTNPGGLLHISSGTSGDCKLIIEADSDNNEEGDNPQIEFRQDGGIGVSAIGHGLLSAQQNGLVLANGVSSGYIALATGTTDGHVNATERMRVDSSGNVGINTTSMAGKLNVQGSGGGVALQTTDAVNSTFRISHPSTALALLASGSGHALALGTGFAEKMRLTSGGDLVLNSDTARIYNGHTPRLSVQGTNFSQSTVAITSNSNGTDGAYLFFVKQRSGSVGGSTAPSNGDLVGQFRYLAGDGTDTQSEVANISVNIDGAPGSNDTPGRITFATTNDGGNASTERMRITSEGHVHIGNGHGNANHRINGNGFTQGQTFFVVSAYSSSAQDTAIFFGVDSGGGNTASCGLKMGRNSSNSRSINAGGTVNASGTDYAEYMTKSSDFTLAKGAICGINAEGKLTNKFSESISFVVKSTDPSYVGGDTWGSEDILGKKPKDKSSELPAYEEKMEAARKMVDRIAFSGQVPVNVTGTTPGQHIIPTLGTDDSITGVAKAEASLSMAEYISSVGKVIALEADGRARIIVKVA